MASDYTPLRSTSSNPRSPRQVSYSSHSSASASVGDHTAASLQKGQTVRGQVTNITARDISLQMENGQNLTARYNDALDLLIGDQASFRVLSADEQGIILRPLYPGSQGASKADATILKALDAAALPVTERNVALVSALLKNNMPIHAPMLNAILQQAFRNPDISIENLVSMNRMGLPIEPDTTQWFENYCNLEHQLLGQLQDVTAEAFSHLQALLGENTQAAAQFAGQLLSIPENLSFLLPDLELPGSIEGQIGNEEAAGETIPADGSSSGDPLAEALAEERAKDSASIRSDMTDTASAAPASDSPFSSFLQLLKGWQLPNGLILQENPPDSQNMVQVLKSILSGAARGHNTGGIRELLEHPFFKQLTQDLYQQNWTLSPEDLLKKEAVSKLYERLLSQLNRLDEAGTGGGNRQSAVSQAKQNLGFLNTLNELYTYVQLPLRLSGEQTHADLYVYTNKRSSGRQEDGSVSCLLHLTMSHLGLLDIRVRLDAGQVKTLFYLEDKAAASLIEAHLPELDEAVARHGVSMTSQVIRQSLQAARKEQKADAESDSPFLHNLLDTEGVSSAVHRYSFDIRA